MDSAPPNVRRVFELSVGIPAYGRPREFEELLNSIYRQTVLPAEITVCEDQSPEQATIRAIASRWKDHFAARGCTLTYIENEANLGYDGNVRKVIATSKSAKVMLMGNDDLMLEHCVEAVEQYFREGNNYAVVSRSFVRFEQEIHRPIGVSRIASENCVFRSTDSSARMILRTTGFVGGLIFDRAWAVSLATDRYDGTLYYQVYLACEAFCGEGIGYIGEPIIGGRSGNTPLFGSAVAERGVHIPGAYTPKARAKMWSSIMRIASDIGREHQVDILTDVKNELECRLSFHIFEMYAGAPRKTLDDLRTELNRLGLFQHPMPRLLYAADRIFGHYAKWFYAAARRILQR